MLEMNKAPNKEPELPTATEFGAASVALGQIASANFFILNGLGLYIDPEETVREEADIRIFKKEQELREKGQLSAAERRKLQKTELSADLEKKKSALTGVCDRHRSVCQQFHISPRVIGGELVVEESDKSALREIRALYKELEGDSNLADLAFQATARHPLVADPILKVGIEPMIVIDIPEPSEWKALIEGIVAQSARGAEGDRFLAAAAELLTNQLEVIQRRQEFSSDSLDSSLGLLSVFQDTSQQLLRATLRDSSTKDALDRERPKLEFFARAQDGKYFHDALRFIKSGMLDPLIFLTDVERGLVKAVEPESYLSKSEGPLWYLKLILKKAVQAHTDIPSHLTQMREYSRSLLERALEVSEQHPRKEWPEHIRTELNQLVSRFREEMS